MTKYFFILLLIAGILSGVYLILKPTSFSSKAAPELTPKQVERSNLTDNSFTVSWITPDKQTIGVVYWGTVPTLGQVTQDDRDEGSSNKERFTHHVTIKKLDPETKYYFKIGSGSKIFDDGGKIYSETTAPSAESAPSVPQSLFGKVVGVGGQDVPEALIYITPENGSLLSSFTREKGRWLLTLNNSRTKDLKSYLNITEKSLVDILVQAAKWGRASTQGSFDKKDQFDLIRIKED